MAYNSLKSQDPMRLILGLKSNISTNTTDIATNTTNVATNTTNIATLTTALSTCTQSIVTGSRTLGTDYQNTSGYTMLVLVSLTHTTAGAGAIAKNVAYVEAGDTTPDTAVAQVITNYVAAGIVASVILFFVVPNDSYYKVSDEDSGGGASVKNIWTEWTIGV